MYTNEVLTEQSDVMSEDKPEGKPETNHVAEQEQENTHSRMWEEHHQSIMECIHNFMQTNQKIPTVSFIARQTGISRPTVYKHLQGFSAKPAFQEHVSIFKLLTTNILQMLYSQSMEGNIRAARLYLELMGVIKKNELVEDNFLSTAMEPKKLSEEEQTQKFLDTLTPSLREVLEGVIRERERRKNEANSSNALMQLLEKV